eukprot:Hpha_TRINITY_DN16283_c3_g2::TRINITY_DN16283_c3_g2_i1::g.16304::m.16304
MEPPKSLSVRPYEPPRQVALPAELLKKFDQSILKMFAVVNKVSSKHAPVGARYLVATSIDLFLCKTDGNVSRVVHLWDISKVVWRKLSQQEGGVEFMLNISEPPGEPSLLFRPMVEHRYNQGNAGATAWGAIEAIQSLRYRVTRPPGQLLPLEEEKTREAFAQAGHIAKSTRTQSPSHRLKTWENDPASRREKSERLLGGAGSMVVVKEPGQQLGLDLTDQMQACGVDPGSAADRAGAHRFIGCILLSVDDKPVRTMAEAGEFARDKARPELKFGPWRPVPENLPPPSPLPPSPRGAPSQKLAAQMPPPPGETARRASTAPAQPVRVPHMPPFLPSNDRASKAVLDHCWAEDQMEEGTTFSFPADELFWENMLHEVKLSPDAFGEPMLLVTASHNPERKHYVNQHWLRSFVRAWERVNPHMFTLVGPTDQKTFRGSQSFWDDYVCRLPPPPGGGPTVTLHSSLHSDQPVIVSTSDWDDLCVRWEADKKCTWDQTKQLLENTKGAEVVVEKEAGAGMGVEITDQLMIVGVAPDSPSYRAGLHKYQGRRLLAVEDVPVKTLEGAAATGIEASHGEVRLRFGPPIPDITVEKDMDEELGADLDRDLVLCGVGENTRGEAAGLQNFLGRRLINVNGAAVNSIEDVEPLLCTPTVTLCFAPPFREPDESNPDMMATMGYGTVNVADTSALSNQYGIPPAYGDGLPPPPPPPPPPRVISSTLRSGPSMRNRRC